MAINSILNNTLSNTAQKFLGINTQRVGQSIERISLGIRVNKAAEDIAGLAISDALRSDIRLLRQAHQCRGRCAQCTIRRSYST